MFLETELVSPSSGWYFSQAKGQRSRFGKHHIISACAASVLPMFKQFSRDLKMYSGFGLILNQIKFSFGSCLAEPIENRLQLYLEYSKF